MGLEAEYGGKFTPIGAFGIKNLHIGPGPATELVFQVLPELPVLPAFATVTGKDRDIGKFRPFHDNYFFWQLSSLQTP